MSYAMAKFEVPRALCREVCANPSDERGVFVGWASEEGLTIDLCAMPSENRHLTLHRQLNGRGLLAKVGAVVHGAHLRPFEVRDIHDPRHRGAWLCTVDGWLAIVGGVAATSGDPVVTWKLLHPDGVRAFYGWLTEWMNGPEAKHTMTRRGYASEREFQEALALERSFECPDDPTLD